MQASNYELAYEKERRGPLRQSPTELDTILDAYTLFPVPYSD
jgi:hypothetical protein